MLLGAFALAFSSNLPVFAGVDQLHSAESSVIALKKNDRSQAEVSAWATRHGLLLTPNYASQYGLQRFQLGETVDPNAFVQRCDQSGLFEYAEVNQPLWATGISNDPGMYSGRTWALHNEGQEQGTPDADIDAPEAWDIETDASDIVIAIIDSGIRYTHEDLAANLWVNPNEIPGNGRDDDSNGIIDDVHGYNAAGRNGNPWDDYGHGTNVAGVIGAIGNNRIGTAGVAWKTQLMALKFLDAQGNGTTADAVACIHYALDQGADIINASWGGSRRSRALESAIARAERLGVPVVIAAGNSGTNIDRSQVYPAAYRHSNILVVGASDRNDGRMAESNYGTRTVDLFAPGKDVYTCFANYDSAYGFNSGTSLAAPFVSGALALLKSLSPRASTTELFSLVTRSVDPSPGLVSASGGRLNLYNTLSKVAAPKPPSNPISPTLELIFHEGAPHISLTAEAGAVIKIEHSTDLANWHFFDEIQTSSTGQSLHRIGHSTESHRFFRIRQ